MKIFTLLTVMFVLFVPTLNVSAASAPTPNLVINPYYDSIERFNNAIQKTEANDTSADTSLFEQIKQYTIEVKNYLISLPEDIFNSIKESLK